MKNLRSLFFLAVLFVAFASCSKEDNTNYNSANGLSGAEYKEGLEEFPYDDVGVLHNEILTHLFTLGVDMSNIAEVLQASDEYLNQTYGYDQDFVSLINEEPVLMGYYSLIQEGASSEDLTSYIYENCDLLEFEVDYMNALFDIINSEDDIETKLENLNELENAVLAYETEDILNKYRLLSGISVAQHSCAFWSGDGGGGLNEEDVKKVASADVIAVAACSPQIATACLFGPWWGVAYAAVAAGVGSAAAYAEL